MKKVLSILVMATMLLCLAACSVGTGDSDAVTVVAEAKFNMDYGLPNNFLYQEYSDGTCAVYQVSGGTTPDGSYSAAPWGETYTGTVMRGEDASGKEVISIEFDTMVWNLSLGMTEEEMAARPEMLAVNNQEQAYTYDGFTADVVNGAYTFAFTFDMAGSAASAIEVNAAPVDVPADPNAWITEMVAAVSGG